MEKKNNKPTLNEKTQKVVCELRDELKKSLKGFECLYVYGSQVRGDYHKDSDIDVVAILNKPFVWGDRNPIWTKVSELEYKHDVCIDLQPYTREELELNYIYHDEVVNKGIFYE
jgi:predicted nucleotidyltransferase